MASVDFSPIGDLFNTYQQARQQAARQQVLGQLGEGSGPLDYSQASRALLAAGDTQGGMSLAALAQQQYMQSPQHAEEMARATGKVQQEFQGPHTIQNEEPGPFGTTLKKTMRWDAGSGQFLPIAGAPPAAGAQPGAAGAPSAAPGINRELLKPDPGWSDNEKAVYQSAPAGTEGAVAYGIKLSRGQAPLPTGQAMRTPWGQAVMEAAQAADPTFNANLAPARAKTYGDYFAGATAKNIVSLNTLPHHLESAAKILSDLPMVSGAGPLNSTVNSVIGGYMSASQSPTLANAQMKLGAVSTELAKAFKGVGALSEKEIGDWQAKMRAATSPVAMKEILGSAVDLAAGRMEAVQSHWDKTMSPNNPFSVMDEKSKDAWNRILQWRRGEIGSDQLQETTPDSIGAKPQVAPASAPAPQASAPQPQPANPNAWRTKETVTAARQNPQGALQEARTAIANGAPREVVIQRLKQVGVDPAGL